MAARLVRQALVPTAVAVVLLASVAACGPAEDDRQTTVPAVPAESSDRVNTSAQPAAHTTFAVVGDSITAGGEVISDARVGGSASWVPAAAQASGLTFVGGWAVPGATTEDALASVVPDDADVLVVMVGTNDVLQGRPWEESAADLIRIAASAGERVVAVVTIAPSDLRPDDRRAYNAQLAQLALEQRWILVDPWTDVESGDGFVAGTTTDGTHLTDEAAQLVGFRVGEQLAALG
jgi:lysophospholipase L1-like esterase